MDEASDPEPKKPIVISVAGGLNVCPEQAEWFLGSIIGTAHGTPREARPLEIVCGEGNAGHAAMTAVAKKNEPLVRGTHLSISRRKAGARPRRDTRRIEHPHVENVRTTAHRLSVRLTRAEREREVPPDIVVACGNDPVTFGLVAETISAMVGLPSQAHGCRPAGALVYVHGIGLQETEGRWSHLIREIIKTVRHPDICLNAAFTSATSGAEPTVIDMLKTLGRIPRR